MGIHKWMCVLVLTYSCLAMEKLTSAWDTYDKMLQETINAKVAEHVRLAKELVATQTALRAAQTDPGYSGLVWEGAGDFLAKVRGALGVADQSGANLPDMIEGLGAGADEAKKLDAELDELKRRAGALSDELDSLLSQIVEFSEGYVDGLRAFVGLLEKEPYAGVKERSIQAAVKAFKPAYVESGGTFALDGKGNLQTTSGTKNAKIQYDRAYPIFRMMAENLTNLGKLARVDGAQLERDLDFAQLFDKRAGVAPFCAASKKGKDV